ncbi:MAG TPA: hypothetical protein VF340_08085 [Methyloceanibacter sp.]
MLAKLLDGETNVTYPAGQKISLTAAKLTCKASNVDIAAHSCDLTFGGKDVTLNGRRAHELFATLAGIGVEPDGAAGSIYEALDNLKMHRRSQRGETDGRRRRALRLCPGRLAGNRGSPAKAAIATPLLRVVLLG